MIANSYSTQQVADLAGVHKDTLLRWLRRRWVKEPARDFRRWRVFTREEALAIAAFARGLREPAETAQPIDPRQLQLLPDGKED